jgi:hypothetical protein
VGGYISNPGGGGGGGGGGPRQETVHSTASLAAGASENGVVAIAKATEVLRVATNRPARVRLYVTAAKRDADAARPVGTDPTGDHGLCLEVVTVTGELELDLNPAALVWDGDAVPDANIAYRIENRDAGAGVVTVTLTHVVEEA